jgi:hypothetical protein
MSEPITEATKEGIVQPDRTEIVANLRAATRRWKILWTFVAGLYGLPAIMVWTVFALPNGQRLANDHLFGWLAGLTFFFPLVCLFTLLLGSALQGSQMHHAAYRSMYLPVAHLVAVVGVGLCAISFGDAGDFAVFFTLAPVIVTGVVSIPVYFRLTIWS